LSVNQSGGGRPIQNSNLLLDRSGKTYIIIVEEAQIFAGAGDEADVTRPGHTLTAVNANVIDSGN
jgi:hypothetical protein